jgi:Tfp pilus assembly protein PilN
MIRVNLLPEEYRKVESTSLSLFLLFLLGVIFVALAFVFWLYLSVEGNSIKTRLQSREAYLEKVKEDAKFAAKLKADLDQYDKRLNTIMAIRAGRIYWSKKLNLLVNDTSHKIWFVSVRMHQTDPITRRDQASRAADGGYLELKCFQKSDDYEILAAYRDKLQKDRVFYADFKSIRAPEFTVAIWPSAHDDDRVTLQFTVVLYINPQEALLQ